MQLSTEVLGDVGVIRVRGDLDIVEAVRLDEVAEKLLRDGARSLLIDVRDVEFMDSSGLRALLKAHQLVVSQGGTITLQRPSHFVYDLLRMVGLDQVLVIDDAPDDNLEATSTGGTVVRQPRSHGRDPRDVPG